MPKPDPKTADRRHPQLLSSRATPRGKPRPRHIVPAPIVEVLVSPRCEHGCFWVSVDSSESVWRVEGQGEGELLPAGQTNVFHGHSFDPGDPTGESCDCWEVEP